MHICLLASGSKGNSVYIESGTTRLLIDVGLSAREITARLNHIGVDAADLTAVLISHEHRDHCRGLGPLARRFNLDVFIHPETLAALPSPGRLERLHEFHDQCFTIGDCRVEPFRTTHDAVAPVGFIIDTPAGRVGIATDLGIATRLVSDRLRQCRALILEFNHDLDMLRDGPYPWPLKQRVSSRHGHLSNAASAALLAELLWEGLETVFLAHLSETNNCAQLAESAARSILPGAHQVTLIVGTQHVPTACVTLERDCIEVSNG
ncbi:MAG: MBL fold metallo-hydrolase [Desulfuromonadaceae bacterium]|nr:MBL fold metallo-hydrolase [Desulfuromonadaceae bacterium]